jgi:DNA-binding CsgD family transcriptional regulator
VLAALTAAAGALGRVGARAPGVAAPGAEQTVVTARARYVARASFASALVWGAPGVVLAALVGEAAVAGPPVVRPALGLTAREAEVARLAARRLTAAEVAAALGISVHTARRHTESVMRKLGVHSRRELAAALPGGEAGAA